MRCVVSFNYVRIGYRSNLHQKRLNHELHKSHEKNKRCVVQLPPIAS